MSQKPIAIEYQGTAWSLLEEKWVDVYGDVVVSFASLVAGVPGKIEQHVVAEGPDGDALLIFDEFYDVVQARLRRKIGEMSR
jgi:hypothetical protein